MGADLLLRRASPQRYPDIRALARRVSLGPPPRSWPLPYAYRIRVQDGDGAVLQPVDAGGRRINPAVRVVRIDPGVTGQ